MSVACPNGHQSETTDYCDQCGARIDGPAAAATPRTPAATPGTPAATPGTPAATPGTPAATPGTPAATPGTPASPLPGPGGGATSNVAGSSRVPDDLCPVCQATRVGQDRFCEGCGFDFTAPAATPRILATGSPGPVLAAVPGTTSTPAWEAVAVADRGYFDRVAPEGVNFPLHCPPRTFLLAGDQIRIGRRSDSRGIQPEVDLTGAPEDSAISHLHCILIEQPDGAYALVDPGSTNGTTLNEDDTPLVANSPVALVDGDQVHIGAWTTITVRARPTGASTAP
jgi:hypothetical protein